ncbi:MAG: ABC transporter ATP-binding protein [Candidatus Omnitrophota bacterium]
MNIEIINLCKSFGDHKVLDNLSLDLKSGETTVIIGRSGCGKSVLLKHIVGLMKPDSGQVIIDGVDITKLSGKELNKLRMRVSMLFQGAALFDSLTIGENVGFALYEHSSIGKRQIAKRVKECLEMVGLRDVEELKPAALSGGMKKRVGLARAICINPAIILYDEPTTGVDPIMGDAVNNLIRNLHDKLKVTSIAVTHDMVSAYKIANRIAMLYDGKIIFTGTPGQVKNTKDPIVKQFITGASEGPITNGEHINH